MIARYCGLWWSILRAMWHPSPICYGEFVRLTTPLVRTHTQLFELANIRSHFFKQSQELSGTMYMAAPIRPPLGWLGLHRRYFPCTEC